MKVRTLDSIDQDKRIKIVERGWHKWFAWRPVVIMLHWHWLSVIERRAIGDRWGILYQYKEIENETKKTSPDPQ